MSAPIAAPARARRASPRSRPATRAAPRPPAPAAANLEPIVGGWQRAFDAAERAFAAARGSLPPDELAARRLALHRERLGTAAELARAARVRRVPHVPWLSPVPVSARLLGLPPGTRACLFDLDSVLTDSASLHAWAWGRVFDDVLLRVSARAGWPYRPFDRRADYRTYLEDRSRLDGIHAFLESRGIRLPEGRRDDPADADTAYGLARRKGELVRRGLQSRGATALPGAVRYLEAAGRAGLGRAVISSSANTVAILERTALAPLVDTHVDAAAIEAGRLRPRPAPDELLVACRSLGVEPGDCVALTHTPAGVVAAKTAGIEVVAVGEAAGDGLLETWGAERVAPSLAALLDRRLTAGLEDA